MTYLAGNTIVATDYNGFVSTNAAANVNDVWGTGSGDKGWGQSTTLATVATNDTVAATNWASLVNRLSSMGSQTNTTLTARSAPVAGNTITILAAVATDLTNCTTNRGNAAAAGTAYGTFSGTTSKTTATGSGQTAWTIIFTHLVDFASADAARYFFNAGGKIQLQYGKSSTGTDTDPDWNTFAGKCGLITFTGRVNGAAQTIVGASFTGTTRTGGTGGTQTLLVTTLGWYGMSTTQSEVFRLTNDVSPYTGEYIRTEINAPTTSRFRMVTTWVSDGSSGLGTSANISGGTAVASPATTIGAATAPTVLCTYVPPSTTYLSASWGTPTITASVV